MKQCIKLILIFYFPFAFTLYAQGPIKFERIDSMIGKQRDQALQSWNGFSSKVIYGGKKGEIERYYCAKTIIFDETSSSLYLFLSWSLKEEIGGRTLKWIIADAFVVKNYSLRFHNWAGVCSCKNLNKDTIYPVILNIRPNSVFLFRIGGYFHFDCVQKRIVYIKLSQKCQFITY